MSRLSILIPVLSKLKKLEDTLISLLENRPANCQIVVVLNEPYADPYQLGDEVCFVEGPRDAGLAESINFGFTNCDAPIVHILSCGLEVSPGWTDTVLSHFKDPKVAAVAPLVLQRRDRDKVISAGAGLPGGRKGNAFRLRHVSGAGDAGQGAFFWGGHLGRLLSPLGVGSGLRLEYCNWRASFRSRFGLGSALRRLFLC